MLLVVTNKTDLACDFLILRAKERGIPFTRLNTEDVGRRYEIDINVGSAKADFRIKFADGSALSNSDISAVYFHQPVAPEISEQIDAADRPFVARETKELLRSLWRLIDADKWLSHPKALWLAANKVEQLSKARQLGFIIPETLVTVSKDSVLAFYEAQHGLVVCKAVKHGFVRDRTSVTVATTQRLGPQMLAQFDEYAPVPMIYQREVRKAFDVRVTVVGDEVFATAIHSQEHAETEVDWRTWDVEAFELRHEAIALPADVADLCRQMTKESGLRYSAIDLIWGADGSIYFLEMNPNGQWAWIERKAGYPIRDAILRCLGFREQVHA